MLKFSPVLRFMFDQIVNINDLSLRNYEHIINFAYATFLVKKFLELLVCIIDTNITILSKIQDPVEFIIKIMVPDRPDGSHIKIRVRIYKLYKPVFVFIYDHLMNALEKGLISLVAGLLSLTLKNIDSMLSTDINPKNEKYIYKGIGSESEQNENTNQQNPTKKTVILLSDKAFVPEKNPVYTNDIVNPGSQIMISPEKGLVIREIPYLPTSPVPFQTPVPISQTQIAIRGETGLVSQPTPNLSTSPVLFQTPITENKNQLMVLPSTQLIVTNTKPKQTIKFSEPESREGVINYIPVMEKSKHKNISVPFAVQNSSKVVDDMKVNNCKVETVAIPIILDKEVETVIEENSKDLSKTYKSLFDDYLKNNNLLIMVKSTKQTFKFNNETINNLLSNGSIKSQNDFDIIQNPNEKTNNDVINIENIEKSQIWIPFVCSALNNTSSNQQHTIFRNYENVTKDIHTVENNEELKKTIVNNGDLRGDVKYQDQPVTFKDGVIASAVVFAGKVGAGGIALKSLIPTLLYGSGYIGAALILPGPAVIGTVAVGSVATFATGYYAGGLISESLVNLVEKIPTTLFFGTVGQKNINKTKPNPNKDIGNERIVNRTKNVFVDTYNTFIENIIRQGDVRTKTPSDRSYGPYPDISPTAFVKQNKRIDVNNNRNDNSAWYRYILGAAASIGSNSRFFYTSVPSYSTSTPQTSTSSSSSTPPIKS